MKSLTKRLWFEMLHDYEVRLEKLAPHAPTLQYQHNRTGKDNADACLILFCVQCNINNPVKTREGLDEGG